MSDELKMEGVKTPSLTLDPFAGAESKPERTLEVPQAKAVEQVVEENPLTPEEQRMVDEFARQININDSNLVMQYGAGAQKKIADFSDTALDNVKTQDLGEVGNMLTSMVVELKKFDVDEEDKGIFGFFKKGANKIEGMKAKYAAAETNVNKICDVLEGHQIQLLKDIAMLDKMYDINLTYFKELSMYILAGKKKLEEVQTVDLPALVEKSKRTGLPEDAQAANDLASMCNRFEKKLHDLELTRVISMQMAPQIRLVQNNDTLMAEKIQSSLVNTIPLWKSQMVLALGVAHSTEAAKAQSQVTDMTNALLRKNAETLKINTIETAKESEKGIVDIETLKKTNESLISTFDEVLQIQADGRQKRREAEVELAKIEGELKNKLLEISQKH
ncbi:MAG: toxic anion resistance protein [Eubacterium aggregans]|uniref:toxic anion resistance protein n=1 Tax=Eubacterium aggregans TaxID=81409 RepID=UPI002B221188|nr:toxic anion resistance protein [Eubacterium aggregans]MEA5072841.1 toxic anion resistance protein [Eubacterium aggregans]